MNLVETRTGGGYLQGDGTRISGKSLMEVDSDQRDGGDMWYMVTTMMMVVYGGGDADGGIWQR